MSLILRCNERLLHLSLHTKTDNFYTDLSTLEVFGPWSYIYSHFLCVYTYLYLHILKTCINPHKYQASVQPSLQNLIHFSPTNILLSILTVLVLIFGAYLVPWHVITEYMGAGSQDANLTLTIQLYYIKSETLVRINHKDLGLLSCIELVTEN